MISQNSYLAIVPARGGSKRLPHKNKLPLMGKPAFAWSVEAAIASSYINHVVVSSDDEEILDLARGYGVETVTRPHELASDTATTSSVVEHVLKQCEQYSHIVLLQPTSPLRTTEHIDGAIELLVDKSADAVISVCEADHNPLWANTLDDSFSMANFLSSSIKNKRSQDLDRFYRINGAIYICEKNRFRNANSLFIDSNIYAYVMNRECSVDIDTAIDFQLAELIMKNDLSYSRTRSSAE